MQYAYYVFLTVACQIWSQFCLDFLIRPSLKYRNTLFCENDRLHFQENL
jgi:hypothetical protein